MKNNKARAAGLILAFLSMAALLGAADKPSPAARPSKKAPPRRTQPPVEMTPLQKQMGALKSSDVNQRRQAVEELAQLRDPHATPALIVALSDEDGLVRAGAARALGLMRSQDAVKELSRILKEDPDPQVRQSAAVALGFIAAPESADALIAALKDGHPGTQYAACQSLASVRSPAAVPALRDVLKGGTPPLRRMAIQSLGEIGDPAAVPDLRPFLKDKDLSVKVTAVESLGKLKDKDSMPAVKKFLHKKNPTELRVAAAYALALQGNPSGKSTALDILADKAVEVRIRAQAARALGSLNDPSLVPSLKEIEGQEPEGYVKQAIHSLIERLSIK